MDRSLARYATILMHKYEKSVTITENTMKILRTGHTCSRLTAVPIPLRTIVFPSHRRKYLPDGTETGLALSMPPAAAAYTIPYSVPSRKCAIILQENEFQISYFFVIFEKNTVLSL